MSKTLTTEWDLCIDKRYSRIEQFRPLKPFIKWVGGKGQLLKNIATAYPVGMGTSYNKYVEPFIGGGAVLFDILSKYNLRDVYISDINRELIGTYIAIRDSVDKLIPLLLQIQDEYLPLNNDDRKFYYYNKRDRYNELKIDGTVSLECVALFIFLNRTCFNGLYRINAKGLYNVPMGSYKTPLICDYENLQNVSRILQNVTIVCGDYRKSYDFIDEQTFVYFDPPYRPLTETAKFTSYTENLFDDEAQRDLAEYVDRVSGKGAKVVLSNSDPKNIDIGDTFFDNLYSKHKIDRVLATRMINRNSDSRGGISELLITN
ncbi:MAG: DNA adenine methylase [Candidatus Adiutrix intracellularis]|jgi:DNA adenine methylase|nr:DNA adenine methylase [Candidatus Adiutrix intracellularis]